MKRKNINQTIGQNILRLRKERGLSRKDFAVRVGRTPETVGHWERGEINFCCRHVILLCKTFGVSSSELFHGL